MLSFLFLIKTNEPGRKAFTNYALFVCVIFGLFLAGGRSGFIGLCVGLLILLLAAGNKFRLVILTCSIIGFLVVTYYPEHFSLFNRNESVDEAIGVRSLIWASTFNIFTENPFLGLGIGNYPEFIKAHSVDGYYIIDDEIVYYGTESGYLRFLTEFGIFGFIIMLLLILIPLFTAINAKIRKVANYNIYFLIAAVCTWLASFSTLYTISDKRAFIVLATLIALMITSSRKIKKFNAV